MDTMHNPMGTDGFEFVEYTAPDAYALEELFQQIGFEPIAKHRSKEVVLYRQGQINFIVNYEPDSFAQTFAKVHGPSACAMGIRVKDAAKAFERAVSLGAKPFHGRVGPMELNIPAIMGIGDSLIYLVDRYDGHSIYDVDFVPFKKNPNSIHSNPTGVGLLQLDHLTHNVHQGRMDDWAEFYEKLFNFREIRYFDIHGKMTGLKSRALASPCGKIRIPINESVDERSQIAEFLRAYNGEGIQHIALSTDNIYNTVETLRARGVQFMKVPKTYYQGIKKRFPSHQEDLERLEKNQILIDGEHNEKGLHILLQIFSNTVIGPIFFEFIQRKGNEGFGEGNFQALFEAIERDQMQRGVL